MTRLRAICLPSSDVAFTNLVGHYLQDEHIATPAALEDVLRPLFPVVSVRARELSGESPTTWYVYRDGRYQIRDDAEWWDGPDAGRATLHPETGEVLEADDRLSDILATTPHTLIGRPYLDVIPPEARGVAGALFASTTGLPVVETVARVLRADGSTLDVEIRGRRVGDSIDLRVRPVFVASSD